MNGQDQTRQDNSRRTPAWLIAAAREVLGKIDLDPASDPYAQGVVQAHTWYDLDGMHTDSVTQGWLEFVDRWTGALQCPWFGHVWLNPPGGYAPNPANGRMSSAAVWWDKLVREYLSGNVTEALFLAFSLNVFRTGQASHAAPYEFPFVVFRDRVQFAGSDGSKGDSPNVDSALVYLPDMKNPLPGLDRFASVLGRYGKVRI
jgi:hypothetical protein